MSNRNKIILDAVSILFFTGSGVWFIKNAAWAMALMFSAPAAMRCAWDTAMTVRQMRRNPGQK